MISLSKHFIKIGVRGTGWKLLRKGGFVFFGTGTYVMDLLSQGGTTTCLSEVLKISVKTPFSWSAQSFKT